MGGSQPPPPPLPAGGAFVVFAGQSNMGGAFQTGGTLTRPWSPDNLTFIWNNQADRC